METLQKGTRDIAKLVMAGREGPKSPQVQAHLILTSSCLLESSPLNQLVNLAHCFGLGNPATYAISVGIWIGDARVKVSSTPNNLLDVERLLSRALPTIVGISRSRRRAEHHGQPSYCGGFRNRSHLDVKPRPVLNS